MIEYGKVFFNLTHALRSNFTSFYDGIPVIPWHAGRFVSKTYNINYYFNAIKLLNKQKKSFSLIASNQYIISSRTGDDALSIISCNSKNGIIVSNIDFGIAIKKRYPNLKIILSITNYNRCCRQYSRQYLESLFDFIVPYYWEKNVSVVNRNKYLLICNLTCFYKCRIFEQHFREICQKIILKRNYPIITETLLCKNTHKELRDKKIRNDFFRNGCIGGNFTKKEMYDLLNLGFNMKIECGRNVENDNTIYSI